MSNKKTKKVVRKIQKKKTLLITIGLLLCACLTLVLIFKTNSLSTDFYKIVDRTKSIEKEKKIDEQGVETIAWLRVQGTNIDTPIVNYDNNKSISSLEKENYVWNEDTTDEHYNQIKIKGHNILNLSSNPEIGVKYYTKFEDLMAYTYKDFVEKNKYIQYTSNGKDYIYKVFAVLYEKSYNLDLYHTGNYTKKEMREYLDFIEEKNLYDFDIEVDENDKIICLVTCTRMYGINKKQQFMVVGRLLRENEKVKNYDVKETAKYKEIEKIMKGDNQNENEQAA